MSSDEETRHRTVEVEEELVRRLIGHQFPRWSGLALTPVAWAGTDNAIFRLGDELVVRLPRVGWAAAQPAKDHRWLPVLAPHLPMAIPEPVELGGHGDGYPWCWSVHRWIEGEAAYAARLRGSTEAGKSLAEWILALRRIDIADGPLSGSHNNYRGVPLAYLDRRVRGALAAIEDLVDVRAALRVWDRAVAAPAWTLPPVWLHGDLHAENLLASDGRLSAVIDFGCLGVGDPACDVMAAWLTFEGSARVSFRTTIDPDEAMLTRASGWALYSGVVGLSAYRDSGGQIVPDSLRTLDAVFADWA